MEEPLASSKEKVICDHCQKLVSRATVHRHRKLVTTVPSNLNDPLRRKRCLPSSDEEDEDPELCMKTRRFDDSDDMNAKDLTDSEKESDQEEEESAEYDQSNLQYWDEEEEDEITRDTSDPPQNVKETSIDPEMKEEAENTVRSIVNYLVSLQNLYYLSNCVLLKIFALFGIVFAKLGKICRICACIKSIFPSSLYSVHKYIGFDKDSFTKYVVCRNCYSLYKYDEIVVENNGRTFAKACNNLVYGCRVANGSTRKKGKHKCGASLLREVKLSNGKIRFYPFKVYCYRGIINGLEEFLKRQNFVQSCQEWRDRKVRVNIFADVYDGQVWKSCPSPDFFNNKLNFAAMLNVDWFQPFKRRKDISVGALYLTIMNLPRNKRFKRENTILVGIIPALAKEPDSLNSFLMPVVAELKALWRGIDLDVCGERERQKVRLALLCAAADIPAARKLLGFMGHGAKQGCSHCKKEFYKGGERNCGGFDVENWQPRSKEEHISYTKKAEKAVYLTGKKEIERTYGYRYTPLLELDYFHPSRFCAIDPMHNLFLGTTKRIFEFWVDNEILGKKDLEAVSERISDMKIPSDIGRIPSNISSNYGTFTAKEWKNWVLVYSVIVLDGLIPEEHLKLWQTFVLACRHLCQPCIHHNNLEIAHGLIVKFCKGVERLYGPEFITPNMHLHCHLKESVRDFGSVYGFWLFGFERFNGILTDLPNNKRSIEIQLMRKFLQMGYVDGLKFSYAGEFQAAFSNLYSVAEEVEVPSKADVDLLMASDDLIDDLPVSVWSDLSLCDMRFEGYELGALDNEEKERLRQMYSVLYRRDIELDSIATCYSKYSCVRYSNELRGSSTYSRMESAQIQLARWADNDGNISKTGSLRPGKVKYYLLHNLDCGDDIMISHVIAYVDWYKPTEANHAYLPPASVWSTKFQNDGPAVYIPIQRIAGRCAWKIEKISNTRILIVCPTLQHTHL